MKNNFHNGDIKARVQTTRWRHPNIRLTLTGLMCSLIAVWAMGSCRGEPEKKTIQSHLVEIRGMQFQPAVISVQAGDTIVFLNRDIVIHDVREKTGGSWGSAPLAPGDNWRVVARKTVSYHCSLHPVMEGQIVAE